MSYKMLDGVKVMSGSRTYELLDSVHPEDHKKAKRLNDFCRKAAAMNYDCQKLAELRGHYQDVM